MRKSKVWLGVAGIVTREDQVLVVKKTYGGLKGKWSFPAGFVEPGETVDEAIIREVLEETGVKATVNRLVAVRSGVIKEEISDNMIVFLLDYVSGEPTPQPGEIESTMFLPYQQLMADPQSTLYLKAVLPKVYDERRFLTAHHYETDPIFQYTSYKIFS